MCVRFVCVVLVCADLAVYCVKCIVCCYMVFCVLLFVVCLCFALIMPNLYLCGLGVHGVML